MLGEPAEPTIVELSLRLRQQELVARFGRFALRHDDLQVILDQACVLAAEGLSTRFAKVLEHSPARGDFVVRAGIGWRDGVVGHARLGGDLGSPAGFAFLSGEAVLCNHLGGEDRFRTPRLLIEHGVHSAINVIIGDGIAANFGVLEADSSNRDEFTGQDLAFLESLANTIAGAIGKQARLDAIQQSQELATSLLEASTDCIKILSPEGTLQVLNARGICMLELDTGTLPIGQPWEALWPADEAAKVRDALERARAGETARFQAFCPTARGTPKWWDVLVAAVPGAGPRRLVAISRDITDTRAEAAAKDRLLREKDLLMQEVHHRVKNSLQMVQNLLSLQARASADAGTAEVLRDSAARVHTIGAIHDRLYREGSGLDVAVGLYLQGLIDDLRDAMASTQQGRSVILDADDATWPAAAVPALGLVTTELVTNALKYGSGDIRVTFRQQPGQQGTLTVEDEGTMLPPDFDPVTSRGLGMRIVTGLLRPRDGGLRVLRDRPNTCLQAIFPRGV